MPRKKRPPLLLHPGKGREYDMGAMRAVFKADGRETARRYSISEWWLEPGTPGPGGTLDPGAARHLRLRAGRRDA